MSQQSNNKELNKKRKEIEDYYKSWVHKYFQKGVKDAKVFLGQDIVVILGINALSFVELSILDDEYSKQVVSYTRKKIVDKNFPILKKNMELILRRKIVGHYIDFSIEKNMSCLTCILGEETSYEEIKTV